MRKLDIIIVGAGLGGLASAIALQNLGHRITVLEKAKELKEVGAGITVQINGMKALQKLGVDQEVIKQGQLIQQAGIYSWDGQEISIDPIDELTEYFNAPCVGIHRGRLQQALLKYIPEDKIRLKQKVDNFIEKDQKVHVITEDGTEYIGDFLIGADGVHSKVRTLLNHSNDHVYAGYSIWRAICKRPANLNSNISVSWGDERRFGIVPISSTEVYWFATNKTPSEDFNTEYEDILHHISSLFEGWHDPIQTLIQSTDAKAITRTRIADRDMFFPWGIGNVTLLGDAAHMMTPNLGQGCCQSFEDAVVLANCLGSTENLELDLREYENRRHSRAEDTVHLARAIGIRGHKSGAWKEALNAKDDEKPLNIQDRYWLYDFIA
ncbi:FAD-dependent monooxygenase [Acinetobacter pecorum]|uniref:FAD-dependent monooxygenase n=1 Tax=Acinetobacter pecorum TaxID=2762215 RepID=UPI003EE76C9F